MGTSDALDDCRPFLGCKRQAPGTDLALYIFSRHSYEIRSFPGN